LQDAPSSCERGAAPIVKASGARTIARGNETEDQGVDLAVWSSDLEPTIANGSVYEEEQENQTPSPTMLGGLIPSCFPLQRSGRAAENQRPLARQQNLYFSPLLQGHGA